MTDLPAWTMSPEAFQARAGVHQPWICEISPMQYAHMSQTRQGAV
jgi:hypothetical protein